MYWTPTATNWNCSKHQMAGKADNLLLTDAARGAPVGEVLRRFWQPAALVEEFRESRPLVPVNLMGEKLALFRDDKGRYGLLDRHCAHRGADLCYGRLEDGGLRCAFHGWLYDVEGRCLEQPAEPPDSARHTLVRQNAYPCVARNGIVFAYLGPGEPPRLPDFDCFIAADENTFAFKGLWECNWLQALEVGIDPAHASYLHRFFEDEDIETSYGRQFRAGAAGSGRPLTQILREHDRPAIDVEHTDYGFRIITTRDLDREQRHYRITNLIVPNAIAIPMSDDMTITQWHVPIDNENCYWYSIFTSFKGPVNKARMREQRLESHTLPDYRPRKNKHNHYGFNPDEQANLTYTGMGPDINVHDQWAVESMGPVQDRTKEHLGKTDIAIMENRRLLRKMAAALKDNDNLPYTGIAAGSPGMMGPVAIDAIGGADDRDCWKEADLERRRQAEWGAGRR